MTDKNTTSRADPNNYARSLGREPHPTQPSEKTGYRNPPVDTRFRPGRSGNPKGRPKGNKNLKTAYRKILTEKVRVRRGDQVSRVTKLEAVLMATVDKAVKGDLKAIQTVNATAKTLGLLEDVTHRAVLGNLSHFTNEELIEFERLFTKASGKYVPV